LNIYLTNSARFKIRGQVLPTNEGAQIRMAPIGSDLTDADIAAAPNANGAFEISGVSPGSYLMLATAGGGVMSSQVIAVNVTEHDVDGVRLTLQQTFSIAGALSLEGNTRQNLSGLRVRLARSGLEFDQRIATRAAADGSFTLDYVAPFGEYDVVVEGLSSGMYVKNIITGGRNILGGKSPIVPNQPLKITLAIATDDLDVRVTNRGLPAAGMQVVLVPAGALRRRVERYITGFTDDSGGLRLTSVPPGDYAAYAFEQIEPGSYYALAYDPSSDIRFKDRAATVTIGASGTKAIELHAISAEEALVMGDYE
jgi:hypothetical protein